MVGVNYAELLHVEVADYFESRIGDYVVENPHRQEIIATIEKAIYLWSHSTRESCFEKIQYYCSFGCCGAWADAVSLLSNNGEESEVTKAA